MNGNDLTKLATYNAECYRGIAHTPEYVEEMARLQAIFDDESWRP